MKTITLKLTKTETDSIWGKTNSNTLEFFRLMECYDKNETFTHHECEVFDVDKFREFLNKEIDFNQKNKQAIGNRIAYDVLKSILSKLDKANDEPKSYSQKVNEEIECIKFEQKQYHGNLDILKEGFIDSDEAEWDGLGITYESVRQCSCSDCGKQVSELELRLFRKHSKAKENLCKDCHSKSTANLSMKEMAELVMEYLPCQKDNDIIYTLEHQFKTRGDLAFMLMAVSKNKYQVRDDIWS